jgi:hypothetical protein
VQPGKRSWGIPALLIVGCLTAACSGGSEGQASGSDPANTEPVYVTPTASPEPEPVSRHTLPRDSDSNTADNRVFGGPNFFIFVDTDDLREPNDVVEVFGGEEGAPFSISFDPGENAEAARIVPGVQQSDSSPHSAALATLLRTFASGLEPERHSIAVQVFDATGNDTATVEVEANRDAYPSAVALYDDVAVVSYQTGAERTREGDPHRIVALDIESGAELWSRDTLRTTAGAGFGSSGVCPDSEITGVLESSALDVTADGDVLFGDAGGLNAVVPASGEQKWLSPIPRCYLGFVRPAGTYPVHIVDYNGNSAIDTRTGTELAKLGKSYAVDQVQDLIAVSYISQSFMGERQQEEGTPGLQVLDTLSGDVVYELSAQQAAQLDGLAVLAAFDGLVWVRNGSDLQVIDARTGQPAPDADAAPTGQAPSTQQLPVYQGASWLVLGEDRDHPSTFLWKESGDFTLTDLN